MPAQLASVESARAWRVVRDTLGPGHGALENRKNSRDSETSVRDSFSDTFVIETFAMFQSLVFLVLLSIFATQV